MTTRQYKSSTLRKSFTPTTAFLPIYLNNPIGIDENFNIMSNISSNFTSNIMIDPAIIQISNSAQYLTLPSYSAPPGISIPMQSHLQPSFEYSTSWQSSSHNSNSNLALSSTLPLPLSTNLQNIWSYLPLQPQQQPQHQPQFNPDEYNMQLRQTLFETLKTIIYRNNGLIYGEYIINEIQCQYMSDEFYKQLQIMYPKEKYNMTPEYLQNAFNNPDILPEFEDRLNKYAKNTMDLIIGKKDVSKFNTEILNILANNYKVSIGDSILLSSIYPDWATECSNLIIYQIIFTNEYMKNAVSLYIIVDLTVDFTVNLLANTHVAGNTLLANTNVAGNTLLANTHVAGNTLLANTHVAGNTLEDTVPTENQLKLPYGIFDFQEQYIMLDGKSYRLSENILEPMKDIEKSQTILNDLILKVQKKIWILMPYAIEDYAGEKFKTYLSFKNIIIDFIIKNNTTEIIKGDYYITNQHKGFLCTRCQISIDSEVCCAVLKCCTSPFHFQCLLECYISAEDNTTLNCSKCNIAGKLDFEGKNSSILMGILE